MAKLTMRMARASLREVGVTIRRDMEWGEYVVRIKGSAEGEGYHTSDLADAYQTGHAMAQERNRKTEEQRAAALTAAAQARRGLMHQAYRDTQSLDERAKREDEAMLGLPRGSVKA